MNSFRRAELRRVSRLEEANPKHQVRLADHDGMPLETSADCLSDPTLRTTNTFRKECKRSRERVFIPTATVKPGYPQRKVSEKSFKQLGQSFRRSYAKRFKHIPRRIVRLEKLRGCIMEESQLLRITQAQNALRAVAGLHDQNIILVNAEILRRHMPYLRATQPERFVEMGMETV